MTPIWPVAQPASSPATFSAQRKMMSVEVLPDLKGDVGQRGHNHRDNDHVRPRARTWVATVCRVSNRGRETRTRPQTKEQAGQPATDSGHDGYHDGLGDQLRIDARDDEAWGQVLHCYISTGLSL